MGRAGARAARGVPETPLAETEPYLPGLRGRNGNQPKGKAAKAAALADARSARELARAEQLADRKAEKEAKADTRTQAKAEREAARAAERAIRKQERAERGSRHGSTEAKLLAQWPHVVPGSLVWDEIANKQSVTIRTFGLNGQPDGNTRAVYTSDLFQTFFTFEVKGQLDAMPKEQRDAVKADVHAWFAGSRPPK